MPAYAATVVPIRCVITFSDTEGVFKLKASLQVRDNQGYKRIVEEEKTVDLGALLTILISFWTGGSLHGTISSAMQEPSAVGAFPALLGSWGASAGDFTTDDNVGELGEDYDDTESE